MADNILCVYIPAVALETSLMVLEKINSPKPIFSATLIFTGQIVMLNGFCVLWNWKRIGKRRPPPLSSIK